MSCMHNVTNHIYCKHAWLDLVYSFDLWCFVLFWGSPLRSQLFYCFVCENRRHTRMERKTSNEICCNNNNFNTYFHGYAPSDMKIEFANLPVNDCSVQVYFLLDWCLMLGVCFPCLVLDTCCLLVIFGPCCLLLASRACWLVFDFCLFPVLGTCSFCLLFVWFPCLMISVCCLNT